MMIGNGRDQDQSVGSRCCYAHVQVQAARQ